MPQLKISITSKVGIFLIDEKSVDGFDRGAKIDIFRQLKEDLFEELSIFFKCQIKVYENTEKSFRAQLPFLGSVRIDWMDVFNPFVLKGFIYQEVDIEQEAEADKKIRSLILSLSKKYPQRYELVVIKPEK